MRQDTRTYSQRYHAALAMAAKRGRFVTRNALLIAIGDRMFAAGIRPNGTSWR